MKDFYLEKIVKEYIKNKSEKHLDNILELMEPYIKYWCQTLCYLPWEKEDLLQVARIAVIGALERFDSTKGIRFKTFAYKTVTGKILNYFRDNTWKVSIPRKYRELSTNISKLERDFYKRKGRYPKNEEVSEILGVDKEEIMRALEVRQAARVSSLSDQLEDDEGKTQFLDFLGKYDVNLKAVENKSDVFAAMDKLEDIQRKIIYMRFYEDMTQSKIAQVLGVSQMQISRLEKIALGELKRYLS